MVQEKFSEVFWKSIDLIYSNNHKEGIKQEELLEVIIKCQDGLEDQKVEFQNMPPYAFQLMSSFKKLVLLDKKKLRINVNWHGKIRVGTEFDITNLDILVIDRNSIIFQERKKYIPKKIIIFLSK